ncbi:hypothetical protein [Citrobacter amalonaticus]|uniref:hypothetical protein n=1 Tax=Citrobacter amalonaticus TaxID=35703 RepID=UPI0021563872|nr:hypothetical protein [Citrobacter amalonaticus]
MGINRGIVYCKCGSGISTVIVQYPCTGVIGGDNTSIQTYLDSSRIFYSSTCIPDGNFTTGKSKFSRPSVKKYSPITIFSTYIYFAIYQNGSATLSAPYPYTSAHYVSINDSNDAITEIGLPLI